MRVNVTCGKLSTNSHGTQVGDGSCNFQMVTGWKLRCVDLLIPLRSIIKPKPGLTRAVWYKRLILYFPSGAWWHIDVALLSRKGVRG